MNSDLKQFLRALADGDDKLVADDAKHFLENPNTLEKLVSDLDAVETNLKLLTRAEKAERACAEMRSMLMTWQDVRQLRDDPITDMDRRITEALSTDCGSGYVRREELDAAKAAIKAVVNEDPKTDVLADDGYTFSFQKNSRIHLALLKALGKESE